MNPLILEVIMGFLIFFGAVSLSYNLAVFILFLYKKIASRKSLKTLSHRLNQDTLDWAIYKRKKGNK
jgi:hypothetical protein